MHRSAFTPFTLHVPHAIRCRYRTYTWALLRGIAFPQLPQVVLAKMRPLLDYRRVQSSHTPAQAAFCLLRFSSRRGRRTLDRRRRLRRRDCVQSPACGHQMPDASPLRPRKQACHEAQASTGRGEWSRADDVTLPHPPGLQSDESGTKGRL